MADNPKPALRTDGLAVFSASGQPPRHQLFAPHKGSVAKQFGELSVAYHAKLNVPTAAVAQLVEGIAESLRLTVGQLTAEQIERQFIGLTLVG